MPPIRVAAGQTECHLPTLSIRPTLPFTGRLLLEVHYGLAADKEAFRWLLDASFRANTQKIHLAFDHQAHEPL
jgi:hypothetical protein